MEARRLGSAHRGVCGALVLLTFLGGFAPAWAAAGAGYVRVETIEELLRRWQPETHLYVVGRFPLAEDELAELAAWLDGRHWTVLLVEDATGLSFTDVDGVVRSGADAVEWGTGQGLPKRPGFLGQTHPRTGEPDGAVFSLVLAQRALYYTSSQAQKSRGLGEFSGGLDEWAKQAMRQSGNVVAAVKDTVSNIDARVEAEIQREVSFAQQSLDQATAQLVVLEARLRDLHPEAAQNLRLPDVGALRIQLDSAKAALDQGHAREATAILFPATEIHTTSRINTAISTIDWFRGNGKALEAAQSRLADLEKRERAAAAEKELAAARESLARARELYPRAAPEYGEQLQNADYALTAAEDAITDADRWAALKRAVLRVSPYAITFLLLWIGLLLIGRRRPAMVEAKSLLAAWRTALDRKLAALYDELEARVARFVGPAYGEGQRSWEGESRRLADEIRADVGSLTILWVSANSVLEKAEALIRARGLGAVFNVFFPHKYRRGIALLRDEPVPFDPADGLPLLFGEQRTWRDDLLGELGSYEPFRKSLQEIVDELNLRAGRAADALDRFEKAVVEGPPSLEETAARLDRLAFVERELPSLGADDGLFLVPAAFAVAAPAAAATLERARERSKHDPVAAFGGESAAASRIAGEALTLVEQAAAARRESLPEIEARAVALRRAAIATGWIEAERTALSQRAEELSAKAATESVGGSTEELARSLADLHDRVQRAATLAGTLGTTTRPEIERIVALVAAAREELGSALELAADRLLREEDADPSTRAAMAAEQADRAQAALGQGDLAAAEAALAEAAQLSTDAEAIVEASRQAFANHATVLAEQRAETARIEELVPSHERILAEIVETFAPSVLTLGFGDAADPNGNWTLADNLEEVRGHLGLAREKADRAAEVFRAGELLGAARLLREVAGHQEEAELRLAEIAERRSRLERTVETNRSLLAALDLRVREGQLTVAGDPRTMTPTLTAFEQCVSRLAEARLKVEATPGDPLLAELDLFAARTALDEVEIRLAPADRLVFGEAQASVDAAARQLEATAKVAHRAEADRVPDSAAILNARSGLETLLADQSRLREALQVEHGDWHTLDTEADRVAAEAAQLAATLTGELEAAKNASFAITSAANKVREAKGYGSGVSEASSVSLARARHRLEDGEYAAAEAEALQAHREASQAIAIAQAALAAEAERRRQDYWQSSDDGDRSSSFGSSSSASLSSGGGGGGGWGGSTGSGSSSSSFGSSSSGSSSSSFGGSGSGSSKSGW